MLTLFVITFLSWLASWADVKAYDEADLPRKYWNPTDPLLIAEGFFAVAVVMAFFRLFRILSLNYYLGPFQVFKKFFLLKIPMPKKKSTFCLFSGFNRENDIRHREIYNNLFHFTFIVDCRI